MLPLYLSPTEAAKVAGMGRAWVYQRVRDGDVDSIKLGRARRINVQSLVAYLDRVRAEDSTANSSPAA